MRVSECVRHVCGVRVRSINEGFEQDFGFGRLASVYSAGGLVMCGVCAGNVKANQNPTHLPTIICVSPAVVFLCGDLCPWVPSLILRTGAVVGACACVCYVLGGGRQP